MYGNFSSLPFRIRALTVRLLQPCGLEFPQNSVVRQSLVRIDRGPLSPQVPELEPGITKWKAPP